MDFDKGDKVMKKRLSFLFLTAMMTLLFSTLVLAAPQKVTGLKQTDAVDRQITIQWDAVLGIDVRYEVSMSTDNKSWTVMKASTSETICSCDKLTKGKDYYVRVRAFVGSDYGAYSDSLKVSTVPEKVTQFYQSGATNSSITLNWNKVDGATEYQICRNNNNVISVIATVTGTSYTIKGLNNKIEIPYSVFIRTVRNSGTYKAVDISSFWDYKWIAGNKLKLIPSKVTHIFIKNYWVNLDEVNLDFDRVAYADGYVYEFYKDKKLVSKGAMKSYFDASKNYFYKIRIRPYVVINSNKQIYGDWSDYYYFSQQPRVALKRSGKKLKISWNKVKGSTSYSVYVSTKANSGYKKVKTLKKNSMTLKKFKKKKLSKKKKYYVYVVANKKVGKKTVKSNSADRFFID